MKFLTTTLFLIFFMSCGNDEEQIILISQIECTDENVTLPDSFFEFINIDSNLDYFHDFDLCDEERPIEALSKNVTGTIKEDIFGDKYITSWRGGIDGTFSSMICCGLSSEFDSIGKTVTYSGIYRSQKGLPITANLLIFSNGDTTRMTVGGAKYNVVKILEISD